MGVYSIFEKNDHNIYGVKFSRNFGQQNAISAGIERATSDYIAILDVDLQDPPELLFDMYEKITSKNQYCLCSKKKFS